MGFGTCFQQAGSARVRPACTGLVGHDYAPA